MRVMGDTLPTTQFTVEPQPNKNGFVLVRFFENAKPFERDGDEFNPAVSGYEYDEYHLELEDRDGLSDDIAANIGAYIMEAKLVEAETKIIPNLQGQVSTLEQENATLRDDMVNTQMALCDVYELLVDKT